MKKLKLEDLAVESFDTTEAEHSHGTVYAEQCTCPTNCTCDTNCTCPGCNTCDPSYCDTGCYSCYGSCGGTCEHTCPGFVTCNWNTYCEA